MRHLTEGIVLSWAGKSVLETSWGNSLDFATWRRKGKRKGWEGKGKAKGEGGKFGTVPNFWAQMNLVHIACDWCRSWSADVNYAVWSARGPTEGAYYVAPVYIGLVGWRGAKSSPNSYPGTSPPVYPTWKVLTCAIMRDTKLVIDVTRFLCHTTWHKMLPSVFWLKTTLIWDLFASSVGNSVVLF